MRPCFARSRSATSGETQTAGRPGRKNFGWIVAPDVGAPASTRRKAAAPWSAANDDFHPICFSSKNSSSREAGAPRIARTTFPRTSVPS